jgi:hypothetical protein
MEALKKAENRSTTWRDLLIVAFGYVAAVLAGSAFMVLVSVVNLGIFEPIAFLFVLVPIMAIYALPGFVVCRFAMKMLRVSGPFAFGFAGACNCVLACALAISLSSSSMHLAPEIALALPLSGLVAGMACWQVESRLA